MVEEGCRGKRESQQRGEVEIQDFVEDDRMVTKKARDGLGEIEGLLKHAKEVGWDNAVGALVNDFL